MRTTLYTTIGVAVGALALGSATLAGPASLSDVTAWSDRAIATAQKIGGATSASEAAALVTEVIAQTSSIANGMAANKDGSIGWQPGEGGLAQAQTHMDLMVKGERL